MLEEFKALVTRAMHSDLTREAIGQFLFAKDPMQRVDLAIVAASPTLSSLEPALALYHAGLTKRIVISGAGTMVSGEPEWQAYEAHALAQGVSANDLLVDRSATNTKENIVNSHALIAATPGGWSDIKRVALCAKPFHMRRVLMTAAKHLPSHVTCLACPPEDPGDLSIETWWQSERGRRVVLEELGRISTYALKGDIGGF